MKDLTGEYELWSERDEFENMLEMAVDENDLELLKYTVNEPLAEKYLDTVKKETLVNAVKILARPEIRGPGRPRKQRKKLEDSIFLEACNVKSYLSNKSFKQTWRKHSGNQVPKKSGLTHETSTTLLLHALKHEFPQIRETTKRIIGQFELTLGQIEALKKELENEELESIDKPSGNRLNLDNESSQ